METCIDGVHELAAKVGIGAFLCLERMLAFLEHRDQGCHQMRGPAELPKEHCAYTAKKIEFKEHLMVSRGGLYDLLVEQIYLLN